MRTAAFESLIKENIRELADAKAETEKPAASGWFRSLAEVLIYALALGSATITLSLIRIAKRLAS